MKSTLIYISGQWRIKFLRKLLCECDSLGTVSHYLFFLRFHYNMNNITDNWYFIIFFFEEFNLI